MPSSLRERLTANLGHVYQIERELPAGGMARVFVAHEIPLDRDVVIKLLAPEFRGSINAVRFQKEIQFVAQLQHPNIVPLHAAGDLDGLPYYVMPYVRGRTLRHRLMEVSPQALSDVVSVLRDVLRALAASHSRGIVHRDIKPENILLSDDVAMIADFGVAKAVSDSTNPGWQGARGLTGRGIVIGTPTYMAPEQATADPTADHRVDLWATGVVAYEMLTGRPPFIGSTQAEIMQAVLSEQPESIVAQRPGVPPELLALVMSCLQKQPDKRPASADAARQQLDLLDGFPTLPPEGHKVERLEAPPVVSRRAPRRWGSRLSVAIALVLLATGLMRAEVRPAAMQVMAIPARPG